MPFTVRQLITKAYYLSGIVARKFQSVSGEQLTDGFNMLNELLSVKGITGTLIPYYRQHSFDAVAGQELYYISELIEPESVTFSIGPVRYSMRQRGRNKYFGTPRANNIESLPYEWHFERIKGGGNLYLYFLPNKAYGIEVWGKFALGSVTSLDQDLLLIYDRFYIKYLTYALAPDICEEHQITLPPQVTASLQILEEKLTLVSPLDLETQSITAFTRDGSINYADVNLGQGWRP